MSPDRDDGHRQGTNVSDVLCSLWFGNGMEDEPVAALSASLAEVHAAMAEEGVEEPLRFTAALSDGRSIYALRHATAQAPPRPYWPAHCGGAAVSTVAAPLEQPQASPSTPPDPAQADAPHHGVHIATPGSHPVPAHLAGKSHNF